MPMYIPPKRKSVRLTAGNRREIDGAVSEIKVYGGRLSERHRQSMDQAD
jgi:hypothetical protein